MEINNLNQTDEISPLMLEWLNQFSDEFIDQVKIKYFFEVITSIKARQFQAKHQDELPIQLTNITGTDLQQINDDCLLEIFKLLTLMDLCSIAKTCERFQQIVQQVFPKEFRIRKEWKKGCYVIESRNFCDERHKRKEVERILGTFGSSLKSSFAKLEQFIYEYDSFFKFNYRHLTLRALHLHDVTRDFRGIQHMFQIIGNSCKALEELVLYLNRAALRKTVVSLQPLQSLKLLRTLKITNVPFEDSDFFSSLTNLEELKIHFSKIPQILTIKSKPIFKRLQVLQLHYCSVEDWTLFAQCDSLVELELKGTNNCGSSVFPKLEQFSYGTCDVFEVEFLLAFVSRHKSLKTLETFGHCKGSDKVMILQEIGNSCKELEELTLDVYSGNITTAAVKASKSLRMLVLRCVTFEDFQFFSSLTNLRGLYLWSCDLPKKSEQFDFLVQLTTLEIMDEWHPDHAMIDVVGIISRLTKLEELTISWNLFRLDEKTFLRIVDIVERRPNVLTLLCGCNFDVKNFDRSEKVELMDIDW